MMFLDIKGEAEIDSCKIDKDFYQLVEQVKQIEFVDAGSIEIQIENNELQMEGSGEVTESYGVRELFTRLNDYFARDSYITFNSIRWEMTIRLCKKVPLYNGVYPIRQFKKLSLA